MLTGEVRVLGYVAGARGPAAVAQATAEAQAGAAATAQAPAGWAFSGDPTWDFYVAAAAPAQLGVAPPASFWDSRMVPRAVLHQWPGLDGRIRGDLLVLGALVAFPILAWPWLDRRRRRAVVLLVVFGAALAAGALLLFAIAHTYVPARTGPRRLVPYELVAPVIAALLALHVVDRVLAPGWRALLPRRGAMIAAGLTSALLCAAMLAPAPDALADEDADPGLTPVGFEAYRWMDANLPADARVLANAYTDGSLAAIARRVGIVDGRAVYLEDRAFLGEATSLVLGARTLFLDSGGAAAAEYLDAHQVTHLLVATGAGDPAAGTSGAIAPGAPGVDVAEMGAAGADLGGYRPFATDEAALALSPRYTLVRSFGDGRLLLYEVVAPAAAGVGGG